MSKKATVKHGWKLTDKNDQTHGGTQWGSNVTHTAPGLGALCTKGWIHYYSDRVLAVIMNPIHGDFSEFHIWKVVASGRHKTDHGLKEGASKVTTTTRGRVPKLTTNQLVYFAILCAKEVYDDPSWLTWANNWIANKDRSYAAAYASYAAAHAATHAAAWAAACAAREAAWAAWAAAYAAYAAAGAAAHAAVYATANKKINLVAIARKAYRWKE